MNSRTVKSTQRIVTQLVEGIKATDTCLAQPLVILLRDHEEPELCFDNLTSALREILLRGRDVELPNLVNDVAVITLASFEFDVPNTSEGPNISARIVQSSLLSWYLDLYLVLAATEESRHSTAFGLGVFIGGLEYFAQATSAERDNPAFVLKGTGFLRFVKSFLFKIGHLHQLSPKARGQLSDTVALVLESSHCHQILVRPLLDLFANESTPAGTALVVVDEFLEKAWNRMDRSRRAVALVAAANKGPFTPK